MRLRTEQPRPVPPPSPHFEFVWATTDLAKGCRFVRKGQTLPRDDVMVAEAPQCFEVRIPLEEVNDGIHTEPGQ